MPRIGARAVESDLEPSQMLNPKKYWTNTPPRILKRALRSRGARPKAPPNPPIREFAVELGRIAGFQPSKRQPLPGIQKLRSAWTIFAPMMQLSRDYRKYGMEDELSVGN